MKNRLIITISDIYGSKQYSVHQIIKKMVLFAILTFILIGVATYIYIELLNRKLFDLREQTERYRLEMPIIQHELISLSEKSKFYKQENTKLHVQQNALIRQIENTSEKLYAVNEQLIEVEEMIGFGPDLNASFQARLEEERSKVVESQLSSLQKTLLINTIPNGKPIEYKRISSRYGYRIHPTKKTTSFHPAVDLPAKKGTPVYAPASGVVVFAKRKGDYGKFVLIEHSFGFRTAYAHLSRFVVKSGDYVSKGDLIAYVGSTGRSTGAHLHYEVRYLDKWLNPKPFMEIELDDINNISAKISKVNWQSIVDQTERFIKLAQKE